MRSAEPSCQAFVEQLGDRLGGQGVPVPVPISAMARALRNTISPFSSHTMTPWGRVSRARRRRMASALDSATASAASLVICSSWLSTSSTPFSLDTSTPNLEASDVSRCCRLRRPDRRPNQAAMTMRSTTTTPAAMYQYS